MKQPGEVGYAVPSPTEGPLEAMGLPPEEGHAEARPHVEMPPGKRR